MNHVYKSLRTWSLIFATFHHAKLDFDKSIFHHCWVIFHNQNLKHRYNISFYQIWLSKMMTNYMNIRIDIFLLNQNSSKSATKLLWCLRLNSSCSVHPFVLLCYRKYLATLLASLSMKSDRVCWLSLQV